MSDATKRSWAASSGAATLVSESRSILLNSLAHTSTPTLTPAPMALPAGDPADSICLMVLGTQVGAQGCACCKGSSSCESCRDCQRASSSLQT